MSVILNVILIDNIFVILVFRLLSPVFKVDVCGMNFSDSWNFYFINDKESIAFIKHLEIGISQEKLKIYFLIKVHSKDRLQLSDQNTLSNGLISYLSFSKIPPFV